jgi:hypothetical protein
LYTVPNIPHLRNLRLTLYYRELMENEAQARSSIVSQKWKQDPDANRFGSFFGPRGKYYVNGILVGEDGVEVSETSSRPFPEKRVPRRGLLQVFPDDPDYAKLCVEQGLAHLIKGNKDGPLPNGVHSPPASQAADTPGATVPGAGSDSKDDDEAAKRTSDAHAPTNGTLANEVTDSGRDQKDRAD